MAAKHDLIFESNGSRKRSFTWTNSQGQPIDLTGYSAKLMIKKSAEYTQSLVELSTQNNTIALGGANGKIELKFSKLNFVRAAQGGIYDLILIPAGDGDPVRFMEGEFKIMKGVTDI